MHHARGQNHICRHVCRLSSSSFQTTLSTTTRHEFTCLMDGMPPKSMCEHVNPHACATANFSAAAVPACYISVHLDFPFLLGASSSFFGTSITFCIVFTKDVHRPIVLPSSQTDGLVSPFTQLSLDIHQLLSPVDNCLALPLIQRTTVLLSPLFSTWIPLLFSWSLKNHLDPIPLGLRQGC